MKNKNILLYFLIFVLSVSIVYSDADEFAEAKKIIDAKTPCKQLTESQLEIIGDYLMEQMHPEQAHELMDKMMGGEGSESLRLIHISMAKRLYCNDATGAVNYGVMGYGMMGMGKTNYGGMMSMMSGFGTNMMGYGSGYGMMGSYGYWSFVNFLGLLLVIGLVVLVYLWVIKLWRDVFKVKK